MHQRQIIDQREELEIKKKIPLDEYYDEIVIILAIYAHSYPRPNS